MTKRDPARSSSRENYQLVQVHGPMDRKPRNGVLKQLSRKNEKRSKKKQRLRNCEGLLVKGGLPPETARQRRTITKKKEQPRAEGEQESFNLCEEERKSGIEKKQQKRVN